MSLITFPKQLKQRADVYHQLGSTLAAGLPIIQSLELVASGASVRSFQAPMSRVIARLHQGATLTDAFRAEGDWLAEFDLALLAAGEQSGRLDATFRMLSDYYGERARLARSVIADLAYPVLVLHLVILIFPPDLLTGLVLRGDVMGFITSKAASLLPLYAVVVLGLWACQDRRKESWRAFIERIVQAIPILGTARRNLALARLSAGLEALISAGVSIFSAWELAAAASGSPALRRVVRSWKPHWESGQTPAELLRESREFPELFTNLYHSGELSGRLEESLKRLSRLYQEEGSRQLQAVAQWMPRLIYFGMLLAIAWQVVSFWSNYYGKMMEAF